MSETFLHLVVTNISQRSNAGVTASIIPLLCTTLAPDTPYDWNYTTTPQAGLNGRTVPYARGKVLGGSTTISEMLLKHAWINAN